MRWKYSVKIYKMREQENDDGDNDDPGLTVAFVSFDIAKLNSVESDYCG